MLKKLKEKNERGITLIALIITIIVMLILAMATISIVLGPNGVIKKASEANKAQEIAADRDQIENIALGYLDENTREIKLADFATENATINGYTVSYTDGEYATATKGETVIRIYKNGRVIKEESTPVEEQGGIGEQGSIVDDSIAGTYYAGGDTELSFVSLDANGNARIPYLDSDSHYGTISGTYEYSGGTGTITITGGEEAIRYDFSYDTVGDGSNKILIVDTDDGTIIFSSNGNTGLPSLAGTYTGSYNGENYTATFTETSIIINNTSTGEIEDEAFSYLYYNGILYAPEGFYDTDYTISNGGNTFIYEQESGYYTITFTKQ